MDTHFFEDRELTSSFFHLKTMKTNFRVRSPGKVADKNYLVRQCIRVEGPLSALHMMKKSIQSEAAAARTSDLKIAVKYLF